MFAKHPAISSVCHLNPSLRHRLSQEVCLDGDSLLLVSPTANSKVTPLEISGAYFLDHISLTKTYLLGMVPSMLILECI